MKSFAVIGLGRFGMRIAEQLCARGDDVLAIDRREQPVEKIADQVTRAVVADAKNRDTLMKLGVQDCDCAIVAMGSDLSASVLITMNLKALKVPKIICKAHDEIHREILEKLGADQIIIPEHVVADKLAASLTSPNVLDYIELSNDYGVFERKAPATWVGKSLRELHIRSEYGAAIIALRAGDAISVAPSADDIIRKDTTLVLLGDYESLRRIESLQN